MKQLKRVSKIKIQSNRKKRKNLDETAKKIISKLRIQSNTRKEGKTLMKN